MALTDRQTQELDRMISQRRDALLADLDQADRSRDLDELRGLEAAHGRIESGEFGVCVDCGRDIAFERLRATPTAIRCIDCQTRHEKTFATPGAPTL